MAEHDGANVRQATPYISTSIHVAREIKRGTYPQQAALCTLVAVALPALNSDVFVVQPQN